VGAEMISKCLAFVIAALALAGCCAFGTTCDVPTAGPHAAWDGLGPVSNDNARPAKVSRPREASARSTSEVHGESSLQARDKWEQQEAVNKAEEARLSRRMIICNGCSAKSSESSSESDGGSTGSVAR
jgi:hypothetical protein